MITPTPVPSGMPSPRPTRLRRLLALVANVDRRSFIAGLVGCLVIGGTYLYVTRGSTQTQTQVTLTTVTRQSIVSTISAAGKVTFSSEQELKFNQRGTVTNVYYQQGDSVKAGAVIATLDESSVLDDIRQAELNVGANSLQLQQAQDSVLVANQKQPTSIASAQNDVTDKKAALDQAKLDLAKQKSTEIQSLASTAQSALTTGDNLLDSYYSILTLGAGSRPQQSQDYSLPINNLLYNDITAEQAVANDYLTAVNATAAMRSQNGSLATQTDPQIVLSALNNAHTLAQAVYQLGEDAYVMLQGASAGTTGYTSTNLASTRASVTANRTTAAALVSQIETAQANLAAVSNAGGIPSNTLKAKIDAVTAADHALQNSQNALALIQTQTPDAGNGDGSQHVQTTAESVALALKRNSLSQSAVALDKLRKSLQDYELIAPFDGTITHIDYKVGDNLLDTGDTEYAVLQNPSEVVVTLPLDQVDVVHVAKGMKATVAFDAITGQTFNATIDSIDPTPITTSGVVSYNVQIKLPAPKGFTILSGMTTTVTIETSRKDNVLAVPNLAIKTQGSTATVQKATGESVAVQTGVTDGQYTEVTSGVSEGDQILSINITRTSGSSSTNANNVLRSLGGLGGGGGFGGPPPNGGGTTRTSGTTRGN